MTQTIWTARLALIIATIALGLALANAPEPPAPIHLTILGKEAPVIWSYDPCALPALPGLEAPKR